MPALHLNDAGTWRQIRNVYVNDAGTWRQIINIYVNDAGTWRLVFGGVVLPATIGIDHHEVSPTDSFAAIAFQTNGQYWDVSGTTGTTVGFQLGTWLQAGSASDYEILAHLESGTAVAAGGNISAQDTWLSLGTTRIWACSRTNNTPGFSTSAVFTVSIRSAATGTVLASTTLTLTASID